MESQRFSRQPRIFLFELHKAHVSKISWQTVDIYMGDPSGIDIEQSIALILGNRSGYCFHLNGAFSTLLRTLGYQVSMHRAGVQPPGTEPRINSFHLGLTATLNNEQGETETYIVDAGLGDMPYEPLPLRFGTYKHGPLTYQVVQSEVAAQGWRLLHDPRGSSVGVDFDSAVVSDMEEFKPKHEFYSQSADSPWTKLFLAKLRNEHGSYELRGCMWNTIDINGVKKNGDYEQVPMAGVTG